MVAQEKQKKIPDFRVGDTIKVFIKVVEGESERIQVFEGIVIVRRGIGESRSFTVRKISFGVGVERTFPLSSPNIDRIVVVRSAKVRRSRLYYLRALTGKALRLDEKSPQQEAPGGDSKKPQSASDGQPAPSEAPSKGEPPAANPAPEQNTLGVTSAK